MHPQRCETCKKAKKQTVSTCSHGVYEFWYCPETKQFLHNETMREKIMDLTALVGCASHSSSPAAAPVLEQIPHKIVDFLPDYLMRYGRWKQ